MKYGLFNQASSDDLMLLDAMATSRVNKLARETGLTAAQKEVEKGHVQGELLVQISLSSHCCLKDHLMGLEVKKSTSWLLLDMKKSTSWLRLEVKKSTSRLLLEVKKSTSWLLLKVKKSTSWLLLAPLGR